MVLVHVEIIALEGVSVHACVHREQADVVCGVLSQLDKHLVVGGGKALDHGFVDVLTHLDLRHIHGVVVATDTNRPMEQRLKRRC